MGPAESEFWDDLHKSNARMQDQPGYGPYETGKLTYATSVTPADAMHASVTFLTWDQLTAALIASCDEHETRFAAFLAASQDAIEIASGHGTGCGCLEEAKAAADSEWAGCQAQSATTRAIAAEMRARQLRKHYGPTATEPPDA